MREVKITQSFLGSPQDVFDLLFGDAFTVEYQLTQGNKQVEILTWAPDAQKPGQQRRTVKYTVPLRVPIPSIISATTGLKDTTVTTTEWVEHQGKSIIVSSECEVKGPPLVKHTTVSPRFIISPAKSGKGSDLELIIQFGYNYMMGVNSVVETTMDSGVRKGFEEWLSLGVQRDREQHK